MDGFGCSSGPSVFVFHYRRELHEHHRRRITALSAGDFLCVRHAACDASFNIRVVPAQAGHVSTTMGRQRRTDSAVHAATIRIAPRRCWQRRGGCARRCCGGGHARTCARARRRCGAGHVRCPQPPPRLHPGLHGGGSGGGPASYRGHVPARGRGSGDGRQPGGDAPHPRAWPCSGRHGSCRCKRGTGGRGADAGTPLCCCRCGGTGWRRGRGGGRGAERPRAHAPAHPL